MPNIKQYLTWYLIGGMMVASAAFSFIYTSSLEKNALQEHKKISESVKEFNDRYEQKLDGLLKTPTRQDQNLGESFMKSIITERKKAHDIWQTRARYLDQGIQKNEVVGLEATPASQPLAELTFAEEILSKYLHVLADTENELAKISLPVWQKALQWSIFATTPSLKDTNEAQEKAHAAATRFAHRLAHIFTPANLLPFERGKTFKGNNNRDERLDAWRQLLIFKDILRRAVVNTNVAVKQEIIGFERAKREADVLEAPATTIVKADDTLRFVQQLAKLEIKLLSAGNREISATMSETDEKTAEDETAEENSEAKDTANLPRFHDVYLITIEMTAHLKTLQKFQAELLNTEELYYVPRFLAIKRLPEKETMGNPVMVDGGGVVIEVSASEEYKNLPAVNVRHTADYSYEPPVTAHLEYLLYRPRFAGSANLTATNE